MKAKIFFLTLLLSSAISSLQAVPMWGEGAEEKKENEEKKAELQQNQQQHKGDATEAAVPHSTIPAPVAASSKKEKPKLTSEQDVERTQLLISKAVQGGDINAAEWVNAGRRIRILEWSQNIITPPPQAPIDWLMRKTPKVPTKEEVDRAGIIQAQALALEAALPAWKKSAIAQQAVKEFSSRSSSGAPGEEATDYSSFWIKAPDLVEQVLQKARESQQAWEEAVNNFHGHINQLPEDLKDDVLYLWTGTKTNAEINNPLAQAWVDELKNLEQAQKISVADLQALRLQQAIESAMAAYNEVPNQSNFDKAATEISKLENFSAEMLEAKEKSLEQFKEQWEKYHKRSNYIKTVYSANLAASRFWALYDKAGAQPTLSADSLAKGNEAVALFTQAIAAKKALFPQGSQLKLTGLELEEPATPEEEAAVARITEFQSEINEIKRAHRQDVINGTEQDDS